MPGAMGLPEFFLPVWRLKNKEHQETEEDIKELHAVCFMERGWQDLYLSWTGRAYSDYEEISGTT